MTYVDDEGIVRGVHQVYNHSSMCIHIDVLRPLMWTVHQEDAVRAQLVNSKYRRGLSFSRSDRFQDWILTTQQDGLSNIMAVLAFALDFRGMPALPRTH
jgi:hypothetical protein